MNIEELFKQENINYLLILVIIGLVIAIIIVGVSFQKWLHSPKMTANMIIVLVVMSIFLLLGILLVVAPNETIQQMTNIKQIPSLTWNLLKYKDFMYKFGYTCILISFLLFCYILYEVNPYNLATKYFGYTTFITLFVGFFFSGMLLWYIYSYNYAIETPRPVWNYFLNAFYILFSIGLSTALIAWVVLSIGSFSITANVASFIANIALVIIIFAIVYRIIDTNNFLKNAPITRLIVNSIFYIPCLLVNLIEFFYQSNKVELVLLVLSILLILFLFKGLPFIENKFFNQGGKQILNEPMYLNSQTILTDYTKLNPNAVSKDKTGSNVNYTYNYALSLWLYLDPNNQKQFVPEEQKEEDIQTKHLDASYMRVFDYGGKPSIYYDSMDNTLSIVEVFQAPGKNNPNITTIYEEKHVKLQKWNHIIINYNGGTMDIFYNGKLVKSQQNVAPYMSLDTLSIGSTNGMNGAICNITYFSRVLNSNEIYTLYNSLKYNTPPIVSNSLINVDYNKSENEAKELNSGIIVTSVVTIITIFALAVLSA